MKRILFIIQAIVCITFVSEAQDSLNVIKVERVDTPPVFNKGDGTLKSYINTKVDYPSYAIDNEIEGEVTAVFVIDEEGNVGEVKIEKSLHPLLDREVINCIKKMPKWSPAILNDKAIPVSYTTTVNFKLPETSKNYLITINNDTVFGKLSGVFTMCIKNPRIWVNKDSRSEKLYVAGDIQKICFFNKEYIRTSFKPGKELKNLTFMEKVIDNGSYQILYKSRPTESEKVEKDVLWKTKNPQGSINYELASYYLYKGDQYISPFSRKNYKKLVEKYFSDCPRFVREVKYNSNVKFLDVERIFNSFCNK